MNRVSDPILQYQNVFVIRGLDLIGGGTKTSAGTAFISMKNWKDRAVTALQLAGSISQMGFGFADGIALAFNPPTIRGLGTTGGLTAAGIATLHSEGRTRWLKMGRPPAETWEHAKPLLRSPVKRRRVWAHPVPKLKPPHVRLAGLSALARYSMLTEPQWPIYALSPAQWKAATQAGMEILPEQQPGAYEWQQWHYNPALLPDAATVDPLSLTLSLQDDGDDRVQLALGELKEHFPW